jgi:hypothetical protein
MDGQGFDWWTRRLSGRLARRDVVLGLIAGGMASAASISNARAGARNKVSICHLDRESGTHRLITVDGNAYGAHIAHGDFDPYTCFGVLSCDACRAVYPIFNCGPGYPCPTGATMFDPGGPLDPTSSDQAKAACEACFGTCELFDAQSPDVDCAGSAWTTGYYEVAFGFEESYCDDWGTYPDPVPSVGRVFMFGNSFPENDLGYWGLETCPAGVSR